MGWKRKALFLGTAGLSRAAGVRISDQDTRTARALEKHAKLQKQMVRDQKRQLALEKKELEQQVRL